jgi:predicted metal-dependent HD superfamily phosphohydrolase
LLVELAGWFHDAIYLPGAQDNELRSAALAERFLADLQLPRTHRAEVQRLILITQNHRTEPEDADGQVLIDADLASLGASPAVYRRQVLAIRDEYGNVDDETFRQGRIWLLQRFLRWDHIYYTPLMRAEREAQARANLQRELEERQRQV